ncbi:hypothetical protein NliqN6_3675 [Naganishia liquefaciens]|uniref:PH domain-containing protein n=1 Tax=Naganishia liquefaciens TaxID=104408 RepID=A0A8H3TUS2_9TREE|nr:hypothetical protein NliqN6_3675 [Naganishia liquefaciens]
MWSELPVEPAVDSPVFRASLTALDVKACAVRKTCKNALQAAQTVHDLLEKLEAAESDLFESLDLLKRQIVPVDPKSIEQTGAADGVVGDLKAWKMKERTDERQRLDSLVISRIRALKTEMKSKGIGAGGSLGIFEDQSKAYYQGQGKYLAPQNPTRQGDDPAAIRQVVAQAEFDLRRYTIHSQLLSTTPPYSLSCVELATCLDIWLGSTLPDLSSDGPAVENSPAGLNTYISEFLRSPRSARSDMEGTAFSGTRRRLRTLSQKASMSTLPVASPSTANLVIQPLKSVSAIKEQLRDELTTLARQKDALEKNWEERERRRSRIHDAAAEARQQISKTESEPATSKRQSFQLSRHEALAKLRDSEEPERDVDKSLTHSKKKKTRGMGQRLKGMIQSASFSANLSSKAGNGPVTQKHEASAAPRKSIQLETPLLLPSSTSPSRPHVDKRHSFTASSSSRPNSYCSPFLPSPIIPAEANALHSIHQVALPSRIQPSLMDDTSGNRHVSGPIYRDLQSQTGMQVVEDEIHRQSAGRKREGMLWTSGVWEDVAASAGKGGERKERGKWEHCWVVLAGCKLYEYRDALNSKAEMDHEVIDLQFANARQGRDTDRRFTFEIVTPKYGKRMYQSTSHDDMKSWIYAICNAVESNINGTGTLNRSGTAASLSSQSATSHGPPLAYVPSGLGLGLPSSPRNHSIGPTEVVPIDSSWAKAIERRTSFKDAFRQGRATLGLNPSKMPDGYLTKQNGHRRLPSKGTKEIHHVHTQSLDAGKAPIPRSRSSLSVPGLGIEFLAPGSRQSSRSSKSSKRSSLISISDEGVSMPAVDALPTSGTVLFPAATRRSSYQLDLDDDMRNAILLADPMPLTLSEQTPVKETINTPNITPSETMTQERFQNALIDEAPALPPPDMSLLRQIADDPSNQTCADCGHHIKGETSQRWATIAIHNNPQVMFICIRCAGIHRSFGTHISKVRSPDLDKWTDEAILMARAWGNTRGNLIWERCKPEGLKPADDSLPALRHYIEAKYIKGQWLSEEDRQFYMNEQAGIAI